MAIPTGLEPVTLCLEGRCSIQLSYGIAKHAPRCAQYIESLLYFHTPRNATPQRAPALRLNPGSATLFTMSVDNKSGRKSFGKGQAWKKSGINVLHLRGTMLEMAAQHGALLKDEIALPYLGQKNAHLIADSHIFRDRPWLGRLANQLIHIFVHKPMLSHVPRHYIEEAQAMARAAGIPYEYCEGAMVQADTLVVLLRLFMGRHVLGQMAGGFPGCTSVVATGKATGGRGIIHARNMDYPAVGPWEGNSTIFYCDPEGPDRHQRYIGITSAGLHSPGITAVNESGLTLAAHFHCARAVSPFGTPIQVIGSEIARRARSIGQAIDIASNFERAGTWSLVVTSAREDNAAVIEMVHGKLSVRHPEQAHLVHTNHFHDPDFRLKEVLLAASVANDYASRYHRASDLLNQHHGAVDRGTMARILADHFDRETGKVRAQGNTISCITTVTSMIAELSHGRFWVGNSAKSPTCLGDYAGFRIEESFENFDKHEPELFSWSTTDAATIRGTPKEDALQLFRDAYVEFHTNYDLARAADCAEIAAKADPDEGHYHLAHGHFRMRLGQPERALEAFLLASKCALSPHMQQVAKLFLGQALDCLGRRDEAVGYYSRLTQAIDPHVGDEAAFCLRRPYNTERATRMTFDLQFCDSFEYA